MHINRYNIGIFGKVNVGKSTLMNLLTEQETSLVDSKPGTTADIKNSCIEFHGLGPVKLFDTAGIDEEGELGKKKQKKSFSALKECDLVLLVIDLYKEGKKKRDLSQEKAIIDLAESRNKQLLIIFNLINHPKLSENCEIKIISSIFLKLKIKYKYLCLDLIQKESRQKCIDFILRNIKSLEKNQKLFPFLKKGDSVLLNIPMDLETPTSRLLRPQEYVFENLMRAYVTTVGYRMDLKVARANKCSLKNKEYLRFVSTIKTLKEKLNLKLIVTDSQAVDIVHPWTLDIKGKPIINITTFSIVMANYMSGGKLEKFVKAAEIFHSLKKGDKILIAEACNHNRISEDIGTYQIPKKIEKFFGPDNIKIDHAFGREFSEYDLDQYKLVIHCGACMIDKQKFEARVEDLVEKKIPITNYGVVLSFLDSPLTLKRVILPFVDV